MTLLDTPRDATTAAGEPAASVPGLQVERLGPALGAIVHDVDLATVDKETVVQIRRALLAHKVLFFRGQHNLDDEGQVRLGNLLGELTAAHPVAGNRDMGEIYNIDSSDPEFAFSDVWHTDVTFMKRPPAMSILRAVKLPPFGGDTSWADSEAAYESLSAPFRALVDQLMAVHDGNREWGDFLKKHGGREWEGEIITELPAIEHPVVRVHPETGRRGLFVNPGFVSHIADVSEAESQGILQALYSHLTQPEHTVRHRWAPGDVGIWDNRATSHYANRDYDATRIMHRVTIEGDAPLGP